MTKKKNNFSISTNQFPLICLVVILIHSGLEDLRNIPDWLVVEHGTNSCHPWLVAITLIVAHIPANTCDSSQPPGHLTWLLHL